MCRPCPPAAATASRPRPPPPSEQPLPNEASEFAFESGGFDTTRPVLRASARRAAHRVRVSYVARVTATDVAGNRSAARRLAVRVR